jgi:aspartyl-tRNA(Asn)/glutamyl-tRNA(Gln) amidotransferase subunit A
MKINLSELTIESARAAMLRGDFTASELWDAYTAVIATKNADLNVYLEVFEKPAGLDEMGKNPNLPLGGIPFAMKDNILINGHIASASSKILSNHVATYDATITKLLRDGGAVFIGRTNMDEFAMGSSTENSAYGRTKNPIDMNRVPGGSSGGSAAAVAMDGALASMGTDTGGSIRQPASFCGLVGLYPTYGTVSRFGLIAMGSSLDQAGPMTKSVADAKLIWSVLSTYDGNDAQSIPMEKRTPTIVSEKRIGIPAGILDMDGIDASVRQNFLESVEKLKAAGYDIVDVPMPNLSYGLAVYYIVMPAEVSSNLARFDGVRYGVRAPHTELISLYQNSRGSGFGPETRRRVLLGTYVLSSGYYDAYYGKALAVRDLIRADYDNAFKTVQAIITPTTPTAAFRAGEKSDPVSMYMADMFTVPANLVGVPAISVPSGVDENNMPLGLHIVAPRFAEETLLNIAAAFESETKRA